MKISIIVLAFLLVFPAAASAQNPPIPPFYQMSGGLFHPAQQDFNAKYHASSDLVWSSGMGLPLSADFLYLVAELSWFRAKGFTPGAPGTPDTSAELRHNFMHVGLMNKYFVAPALAVRFQGGMNYNSIEEKVTPAGGTEMKRRLPRKIGFYGGIGLENLMAGGRMSVFTEAMYDYRRSVDAAMYGDFGGVRVVAGLAVYWF